MTALIAIIALVCIKLWNDMADMRRRISALEVATAGVPVAIEPFVAAPPVERVSSPSDRIESFRPSRPPPVPVTVAEAPASRIANGEPCRTADLHRHSYAAEDAVDWGVEKGSAGSGVEDLFGRTLPIWGGGITLAIAGVLVVKWSIDAGLLSPAIRVVFGMLFGMGLVGGAEVTLRGRVSDDRIPQALAGAGVASLYGAVLAANLMYALLGDVAAMSGMVAVSLVAAALSMRFGAPSAVLGLVGGLVAPALVGGSTPDVPLLSIYVAMVSGGATILARVQQRPWLGGLSMLLSTCWALFMVPGDVSPFAAVCLGSLMLFIGFAIPRTLAADREGIVLRTAGAGVVIALAALLVAAGGHGMVQWFMMALATVGVLCTSEEDESFRDMPAMAMGAFVALVIAWPQPSAPGLLAVVVGFSMLHALHALRHLAFCEYPRLANGLRLVALPVLACVMISIQMPLDDLGMFFVWGLGAIATAGAIVVISSSGLEEPSAACQPLAIGMVMVATVAVLPVEAMPAVLLGVVAGLSGVRSWRIGMSAAAATCAAWCIPTVMAWLGAVVQGATTPLLVGSLPLSLDMFRIMLPAAVAVAILGWRMDTTRIVAVPVVGALCLVIVHVIWRRTVGIATLDQFVGMGVFDRTGWQALLATGAVLAWRIDRRLAAGLALASLAHFGWFGLLRFDPLWSEQAVGTVPLFNMIAVSHAVPLCILWMAGRAGLDENWERIRRIGQMALVSSLCFGLLRQAFAGSLMANAPVSSAESITYSLVAIGLAIGFLLYGIWALSIEWRAGSLVLMLAAISKVFLLDAAGLDGLARVASFAALGFSLIGVGWLYSRLLGGTRGLSVR